MKKFASLIIVLALAACGGEEQGELKTWMRDQAKSMKGRVPPLPPVKSYTAFDYAANELPDPFRPSKIEPDQAHGPVKGGGGKMPDFNRKKEPLEAYPLESLKMVGTLQQDKTMYALIRADTNLYRVKKDNYMGANFGKITDISESEVTLKELVQDAGGDWTERTSSLQLNEEAVRK
jgi:type IV pilus assembly protein PilP